jgi:hypothetical protein
MGLAAMRCSSTASSSSIENTVTNPATVEAA